jgi:biopolymer transport protein ExbD
VGAFTFLLGAFLYWSIPIALNSEGAYPWSDRLLAQVLFWFCVSLTGAGCWLLFRGSFSFLTPNADLGYTVSMFPGIKLRNVLAWQRFRPTPVFASLPNFGLVYGAVVWALIMIFMLFPESHFYGLPIDLSRRTPMIGKSSSGEESLGVYLGVGEKFYVNGELVAREALAARLRQELNHRLVWTVYFEADYDTLNMNAIYAMDVIQGLGAKLIWITPRVREELRNGERSDRSHPVE